MQFMKSKKVLPSTKNMNEATKAKFEAGKTYMLKQQYGGYSPDKVITVLGIEDHPSGKSRIIKYQFGRILGFIERTAIIHEDNRDYEYFWSGTWSCRA